LDHLGALVWHYIDQLWRFNFIPYGLGLPYFALVCAYRFRDGYAIVCSALITLVILLYLRQAARKDRLLSLGGAGALVAAGLVVFTLGYLPVAAYLTSDLTSQGLQNRISIVAAIGASLCLVGCIAALSRICASVSGRVAVFVGVTALFCGSGDLAIATIGHFWKESYRQQLRSLSAIREAIPQPPRGASIILDGACPFAGPATVWGDFSGDLSSALQLRYGDYEIRANIVAPWMRITPSGLYFLQYNELTGYPFGEKLLIYNQRDRQVYIIRDYKAAGRYFQTNNPDLTGGCPVGHEGDGIRIF
jgi:hypothetical protein